MKRCSSFTRAENVITKRVKFEVEPFTKTCESSDFHNGAYVCDPDAQMFGQSLEQSDGHTNSRRYLSTELPLPIEIACIR